MQHSSVRRHRGTRRPGGSLRPLRQSSVVLGEAWLQALKEANQTFSDFYDDSSAVAPFPTHWLKLESKCLDRVDSTKKAAQTFLQWKADLGQVMDATATVSKLHHQPSALPQRHMRKLSAFTSRSSLCSRT